MALTPGTRLGPYNVTALLGEGGMGQVYRATDTNLKRQVAIKVLPAALAADPDRLARFQREAEVLAALNHPNIAAIYGLEKSEGITALVMELVEGDDLSLRLARGAIPLDEALLIAKQITEALEAAHEQGIVHRDLKPANIKVRADGTVKVLDFGLAKAMEPASAFRAPAGQAVTQPPTITQPALTEAGMLLGTAAYMSPEQARGKPVDRRADIWAFGCVLFEMLTGRRPFRGDTITDVLAAVVGTEPDLSQVPWRVRRLVRACLEKDPRRRLQAIADAWLLLDESAPESRRPPTPSRLVPVLAAALALAVVAVVAALWTASRRPDIAGRPTQFQVSLPSGAGFQRGIFGGAAISPDGRAIVFVGGVGRPSLWVRRLDALGVQELPGTLGAAFPFWAPDSRSVGFFADGKLKRIDMAGGPPVVIAAAENARGGSWGPGGTIVLSLSAAGLHQVAASGGVPAPLTTLDSANSELAHRWPQILPDGRHLLYYVRSAKPQRSGIYLGSLDHPNETVLLVQSAAAGAYAAGRSGGTGHVLWVRDHTLMAQAFDPAHAQLIGEPVVIPGVDVGIMSALNWASFSVSHEGTLMTSGAEDRYQLAWLDREGKVLTSVGAPDRYTAIRMSPDGGRAALSLVDASGVTRNIYGMDLARGLPDRLTGDGGNVPVWSPDGRQIAYHDATLTRLVAMGADGDHRRTLLESKGLVYINDWSSDGRFLMYTIASPTTTWDLWLLPATGDSTPVPLLVTPFSESHGQFSPDGQWIAYTSDESGQEEVYVRGRTAPGSTRVSASGGSFSRWRQDGRELFYRSADGKLMAASVAKDGDHLAFGAPNALFPIVDPLGTFAYPYDVAPDGKRILALTPPASAPAAPLTVTLNWEASLGK